jgi:hypothetical protein
MSRAIPSNQSNSSIARDSKTARRYRRRPQIGLAFGASMKSLAEDATGLRKAYFGKRDGFQVHVEFFQPNTRKRRCVL